MTVLVVTRFIVPENISGEALTEFLDAAQRLQAALASRPGHVRTTLARAADDPSRWLLMGEWAGIGPWRRALSAYDVRVEAVPLMAHAEAEPGVYETFRR